MCDIVNNGDSFVHHKIRHSEDTMRLEIEPIAYRDGDARLNGLLVVDADRAGTRPGVLVVHGGAGIDDHTRGRARRFAESGFAVFACDMYGEGVTANRE